MPRVELPTQSRRSFANDLQMVEDPDLDELFFSKTRRPFLA